jgi:hypothetical protein
MTNDSCRKEIIPLHKYSTRQNIARLGIPFAKAKLFILLRPSFYDDFVSEGTFKIFGNQRLHVFISG